MPDTAQSNQRSSRSPPAAAIAGPLWRVSAAFRSSPYRAVVVLVWNELVLARRAYGRPALQSLRVAGGDSRFGLSVLRRARLAARRWVWAAVRCAGVGVLAETDVVVVVSDVGAEGAEALGPVEAGLGTCFAGSGDCAVLLSGLGFWSPAGARPMRVRGCRRWPSRWAAGAPGGSQK